jgi:hypothetical protein
MWSKSRSVLVGTLAASAVSLFALGCDEPKPEPPKPAASAPAPTPSAAPAPTPAPSASAAPAPVHDCPKDAPGDGTFAKPCEAKGSARQMEVTWTGKTDDKGPWFRVINKTQTTILYGKIAVYFYDKAGKQLEVKDPGATTPKPKPFHTCFGMMFAGVVKPAEKIVVQISCVGKQVVPEGTAAIEAEMQTVGYADASEKKIEYYWRNPDLAPDARKKGAK